MLKSEREWRVARYCWLAPFAYARLHAMPFTQYGESVHGVGRALVVVVKEFVLLQLLDPSRRVASDHDLVIVDVRIPVRFLITQDRPDDLRQLVSGGDDGSFVAASRRKQSVLAFELTVLRARCGVRTQCQDGSQMDAAAASAARASFASALIVARANASPSGEFVSAGKRVQVRTYFRQNVRGRLLVDARNGLQQVHLLLPWLQHRLQVPQRNLHVLRQLFILRQQTAQQDGLDLAQ